MADSRVSDLSTIAGASTATGDKCLALDVSDVSGGAGGTLKGMTRAELALAILEEGAIGSSFACISDQKSSGTDGGAFTSGAWRTRDLQTEDYDPDNIVSITSNQFTLQAGTYRIQAWAMTNDVDLHQVRLQNITDATTDLLGLSCHAQNSNSTGTAGLLEGYITIAGAKAFEVQHRCSATNATIGFGAKATFGVSEKYTQVIIEKIA